MNINLPTSYPNTVSPFNPLGRQPVGEEGQESKASTFKAVEQGAETARSENRTEENRPQPDVIERKKPSQDRSAQAGGNALAEDADEVDQQAALSDQQLIEQLAARDREVRAHERAHAAVGGQYTGAPQLNYVRGPDGVAYATSGEVSVSLSSVSGDPHMTLRKAEQIKAAALAPADPSSQDRLVAAKAARMAEQARTEIRTQDLESQQLEQEARLQSDDQRAAEAARSEEAKADREARQEALVRRDEVRNRNVDLNQKLLDIGVRPISRNPGDLLDQTV